MIILWHQNNVSAKITTSRLEKQQKITKITIFQIDEMVSDGPRIEKNPFLSFSAENGQKH